jgi:hypothetical protein
MSGATIVRGQVTAGHSRAIAEPARRRSTFRGQRRTSNGLLALVGLLSAVTWACSFSATAQAKSYAKAPPPASAETRITGDLPPALSAHWLPVRTQDRARPLTISMVLKRTDEMAFERYVHAVEDRSSPLYRHYLSQSVLADRFGPSLAAYHRVEAWLRSQGFRILQGSANRLSVTVHGTRALAEKAFQTPIRDYRVRGHAIYANVKSPAVPGRVAPQIQSVMGLSNRAVPVAAPADQHTCDHSGSLAFTAGNAKFIASCTNLCLANVTSGTGLLGSLKAAFEALILSLGNLAVTGVSAIFYYGSYCVGAAAAGANPGFGNWAAGHRGAFGFARRRTGAAPQAGVLAQKIGLLEFDTYRPSDVTDWLNLAGFDPSAASHLHQVNVNGGVASPGAGESEVLLDIDTVLAGAPLSNVVVYDAPTSTSFVQMLQAMIADGDTVISNSWSQCEDQTPIADAQAIDSMMASAAASGITVLNGTGDSGSTCLDGSPNTIGVPADSPHATAVGGTTPTFGPGLTYGSESWWNDQSATPAGGAAGFGVSRYFNRPAYQDKLTSSATRSVPDLSFVADPHAGVALCQADGGGCPDGQLFGGTSMAVPTMAALVADFNEQLGHNVGDLNAALYPLAGTSAFHSASSMSSDFAHVGLGSPSFAPILQQLTGVSPGPVSNTASHAAALGDVEADGSQKAVVRVDLADANGLPVGGKQVTLTPSAGSNAVVTPSSATTDTTDGATSFTVTDTTAETVTFAVTDTTDGVTLATPPSVTFEAPAATGAQLVASPSIVANDGTATATVTAYLQDARGRPAAGKTVSLSEGGGQATITPASRQAVTGTDGTATFTATDTSTESVAFSATDVTDGGLPVPDSATVTFQPQGAAPCNHTAPVPTNGFALSVVATGFPDNPQPLVTNAGGLTFTVPACAGHSPVVFDSSGTAYETDGINGEIYTFGPAGAAPSAPTPLPDTSFQAGGQLGALAFGKHGELYASLNNTNGDFNHPEIVQLDPSTGAVERVIATAATGLGPCPGWIAVDPLSGDIFTTDNCGGALASGNIWRVSNPAGPNPATGVYATVGKGAQLTFAPDGTLYVADLDNQSIMSVSGTNTPTPVVSTVIHQTNAFFGLAVASTDGSGHATALDASDDVNTITRVDLVATPATATTAATWSGGGLVLWGATIGPDGCLYVVNSGQLMRMTGVNAACASGAGSPGHEIALSSSGPSPAPTGSSVTFTAQLSGFASAPGTPVSFIVSGANAQVKLVHADAGGRASLTVTGALTGGDSVQAFANDAGAAVSSASLRQRWSAGSDVSFLSVNGSQESGPLGAPAKLDVQLIDISQSPPTPIAGASVQVSLEGQSCSATTDASGSGSCSVVPPGPTGLVALNARYAGDSSHSSSTATDLFAAGGLGLPAVSTTPPPTPVTARPASTMAPIITGTVKAGKVVSCTTGGWLNSPTRFAYQWSRDTTPIVGATRGKYTIQRSDEGLTLTCTVTASNAAGSGRPATSKGRLVPVPFVRGCPRATGRLSRGTLGLVRLGMTPTRARHAYQHSSRRGKHYQDFFCLTPIGVRVGYASPVLLQTLKAGLRRRLRGRVVWASTASAYFSLHGIRAGATVTAAARVLKVGSLLHVGRNFWYLAPNGSSTAVLKVRRGIVEEIGIGDPRLTRGHKAQLSFLKSFS